MTSKDEDIAGVPLQCLLIADVYEDSAVDFADPENVVIPNCQAVMNVQTIADLYEALFAKKIKTFFQTQTSDFEVSNNEDLMRTHVFLSLKLIFPEWAKFFKKSLMNHRCNTRIDLEEAVLRIGIVESTSIRLQPICFSTIRAQNICRIFYSLITTRDASSSLRHFVKMDKYRSFIREMTLCTVTEDYFYLFEFLNDMDTFEHEDIKTIFTPNLAYVLIGQCNLPFVKLVLNHYDQDQVGAYKKDNRSILNVAVERGEYSIVEFLIYSQGFRRKVQKMDVPNLLHDCVTLSLDNDSTTVQNKIQIVKLLVNCNPLILEEVYEGARPIHRRRINIRFLIELINQGADVLSLDEKQCCLLHTAAVYLTPVEYFQILNTVSTDALKNLVTLKEQYEQTPLHLIVESERHLIEDNILKIFHDHGADFNSCNEFGETVLTSAIKEGRDKKCLEKLIGFGADYKFIHNTENSMLHVAAQAGNLDAVKFLVGELGLDTNAKNGKGLTPLHASLFGGAENRFMIWDYLVEHGADETLVPFDVTFFLHEAIQRKDLDSAKWCIEKGADVNARNKNGYTSLHQVLAKLIYNGEDQLEMTKLLLKHGAEVNAVNRLGETPLSFALNRPAPPNLKIVAALVCKGALNSVPMATLCLKRIVSESGVGGLSLNPVEYVKLAESCVQKGGIISYTDQEGNTMLHFAASSGCAQGIKYLMSKNKDGFGLDVNASNKEGNTPLHSALVKHDDDEVVNLLVDFGTNLALVNSRNHTVFHTAIKHKRYYSSKYLFETERFYELCGEEDFLKFVAAHGSLTIFKLVCEKFNAISGEKVVEINESINESNFPDRSCLHPAVRNGNHEVVKYLLNTQGFKNCLNQPRMRDILHVFMDASRYTWLGDEIPKLLIKAEPSLLLEKNSEGKVPLLIPGTVSSLLKCLVQLGADIRSVDKNGDTVLHIATSYRTWTDYKKLLKFITRRGEGSLLCARGRNKATVLHRVAAVMRWNSEYWGIESVLDYFVAQNADFNAVDEAGDSILAYAIRGNCKHEDLEILMKRGATNLQTMNSKRQGLLHEAVRAGNISVLKFLFETVSDWDLNAKDGEGNTLIHYAVMLKISWETDAVDMIKRLLDIGADLNCRNKNGDTVVYLAPQYMSALDYDDFLSVALDHDKRAFNHKCQHQRTPLHNAVECLELRLCKIEALAAHEDLNAVDERGSPIIFSAVTGNRSADFIRQLVQLGADWRQTNRIEANALHIAASKGHLEAAKYFMELGLSPEDVDLNGKSAV
ncbi:unnamed protein product [Orchesella dallaii]|uniref:Uncharacterized protein n=1 Tax=Orchesella dallaii TaxID=48710 RepID=A0ABP1RPE4_9HEXA